MKIIQSKTALLLVAGLILSSTISLGIFAKGETGMVKSSEHRSAIAKMAIELNRIADRNSGIGKELREIAKEQNDSKEKSAEAIEEVENRNALKTFLLGTDYKNLGTLRSAMVTTNNHINRLTKAKERTTNPTTIADLDKQITALQAEKNKIAAFIKANEDKFSLFGWFIKDMN